MKRALTVQRIIVAPVFLLMILMIISCAGSEKIEKQISGKWQPPEGKEVVAINLATESKSISIGEKTYPATIEKVDEGAFTVSLKVKTESGPEETWTLRQVWNDNGSDFKLVFNRNGSQETLVHGTQS